MHFIVVVIFIPSTCQDAGLACGTPSAGHSHSRAMAMAMALPLTLPGNGQDKILSLGNFSIFK